MNSIIPVFFAVDDNYIPYLKITLASLEEHASEEYDYDLYILNMGLSLKSKKALEMFNKDHFHLHFYNVSAKMNSMLLDLNVRDYYTKTTYYRLFIASIFKDIDKALYLDCDIAVLDDISKLYQNDIENNYVGAVVDSSVQLISEFEVYVEKALGINHENYFNAGILLMNFKKMREDDFESKVIDLLDEFSFEVAQDQDVLNVLCKDKVTYLPLKWNQMPFGTINDNPSIVHYNLSYKPWKTENILYENYFWDYAEKLGIKETILKERNKISKEANKKWEAQLSGLKALCLSEAYSIYNFNNQMMLNQIHDEGVNLWMLNNPNRD